MKCFHVDLFKELKINQLWRSASQSVIDFTFFSFFLKAMDKFFIIFGWMNIVCVLRKIPK